jgi:hypothetical protein
VEAETSPPHPTAKTPTVSRQAAQKRDVRKPTMPRHPESRTH